MQVITKTMVKDERIFIWRTRQDQPGESVGKSDGLSREDIVLRTHICLYDNCKAVHVDLHQGKKQSATKSYYRAMQSASKAEGTLFLTS